MKKKEFLKEVRSMVKDVIKEEIIAEDAKITLSIKSNTEKEAIKYVAKLTIKNMKLKTFNIEAQKEVATQLKASGWKPGKGAQKVKINYTKIAKANDIGELE